MEEESKPIPRAKKFVKPPPMNSVDLVGVDLEDGSTGLASEAYLLP